LYVWLTESIAVDLAVGTKSFSMSDLGTIFARRTDVEPSCKLEIFQNALEICRVVLRDTASLARDLKQQRRLRDETGIPKNPDCIKPTTIYFMICFSLCHIAMVLHSQSRLSIVPGMIESLLTIILSKPSGRPVEVDSQDNTSSISLAPQCLISKAQELAIFAAHCAFTSRALQEV